METYPELLRQLLFNRGITTKKEAEKFLNPSYEADLHDPTRMLGMDKAVERVLRAVENDEKIVIYGDYDCDGIPGSVILHDFFKKIGYENFEVYIPDRHEEGYGLKSGAIEKFYRDGVKLIITVDLGISDVDAVSHANSLGIDVIITDHHLPKTRTSADSTQTDADILPEAYAILNPKQKDCSYPFKELCGAGVVFKLVQALISSLDSRLRRGLLPAGRQVGGQAQKFAGLHRGYEKWLLDMAGLATLSDMVPLRGENRALAFFGLKVLRKSRRAGLKKLFEGLKMNQPYLTEDDISFMVIPRLNAASRMDVPKRAFQLLSTDDPHVAEMLVDHLDVINEERKALVAKILREVKQKLKKRETKDVIVVGNPSWQIGVLGLVSSRLCEEHERPVFVWGRDDNGVIKGSCRSDGSVNLVSMMTCAQNQSKHGSGHAKDSTLLDFGGHENAGGFIVSGEKIHFLEEELIKAYRACATEEQKNKRTPKEAEAPMGQAKEPELFIDGKLSLGDVTMENYEMIEKLGPFGMDNPKPTFLFEGVEITAVRTFGKNKNHLELSLRDADSNRHDTDSNRQTMRAITFFRQPDSFDVSLEPGKKINLIANFEKNVFRDQAELRLRIVDII